MPCSAFLFFGRDLETPKRPAFLVEADLGNTPFIFASNDSLLRCQQKSFNREAELGVSTAIFFVLGDS